MKHLSVDIETFSDVDIKRGGVFRYVDTPAFEILLFAYSVDFGPVAVIDLKSGESIPKEIVTALHDESVIKHAYNAAFEITCLNKAGYVSPVSQWRCTMIHGMYLGYPAGLANLGKALSLPEDKRKLSSGRALIKYFCVPCAPTKRNGMRNRNLPEHDMEKWNLFIEYCRQDVVTEMEDYKRLAPFSVPTDVQKDWEIDYQINSTGIAIDLELVAGALQIDAEEKAELMEAAVNITGLSNPNSRNQLLGWINATGNLSMEALTKKTIAEGLQVADDKTKEVLRLRQKMAKSSVTKYIAMRDAVCTDGRVRGLLQYYGANRTGRWAGRLVQIQNLPRNYLEPLALARDIIKKANRKGLALMFGDVSDTLSQLIRTAFVAKEGCTFCVSDFSAIEARVLSWMAGETWRQDVFANGDDIYCASASNMFGVPVEKNGVNGHLRQKGKVAELALGYQGGANALISMGALDMGLSEDELPDIVSRWRQANPRIKDFWYAVEQAALSVMESANPVGIYPGIIFAREMHLGSGMDFLTIQLPSGRKLYYPGPYLSDNQFGRQAIYYRTEVNHKWSKTSTYGGKLVENITQAVARDCLALAIRRLAANGYQTLMHIHDEVVLEVPKERVHEDELERINSIMCAPIDWAPGLLLNAAGFINEYYMKD